MIGIAFGQVYEQCFKPWQVMAISAYYECKHVSAVYDLKSAGLIPRNVPAHMVQIH